METLRIYLFLIAITTFFVGGMVTPGHTQGNEKSYALLTYKLTDYFVWPNDPKVKTIGVFGNSKVVTELDKILSTKKNKRVEIIKINSLNEIAKCNIIFLPLSQSSKFSQLLRQTKNLSIIIVTESEKLAKQGAGISFFKVDDRIKIRLNRMAIESKKIKVSSNLLSVVDLI
jgi:hypothetical protein